MNTATRRFFCLLISICLTVAPLTGRVAFAQTLSQEVSEELDVIAPRIEPVAEQPSAGIAGEAQSFRAVITDNNTIASVILFHRFAGDPEYFSTEMLRVGAKDTFQATVVTTVGDRRDIEYYVEAVDIAGNRAVLGFPFDPLRLTLAEPVPVAVTVDDSGNRQRILWGVAGLVVLALVIGAVGSDDSTEAAPETGDPLVIEITESQ